MILEEETFNNFGYYPQNLKLKSNKRILAKCDGCGKIREISKSAYVELCHSCSMKTEKTKEKMKEAQLGRHHTEETKKKISTAKQNMSEATKQKIRDNHVGMKGKHHSEETKRKISEVLMGRKFSEETKLKLSDLNKGSKHPNWKGGVSFEPYCIKFDDEFKERVREYWNRKCILCEKTELENGRKLDVHHVMYNKDTCCDDSIPLFVPLCNLCHGKTNFNREDWQKEFIRIIYSKNADGKCFFNKEEIINNDNKKEIKLSI